MAVKMTKFSLDDKFVNNYNFGQIATKLNKIVHKITVSKTTIFSFLEGRVSGTFS